MIRLNLLEYMLYVIFWSKELNQLLVLVLGHDFQIGSLTEKTYKQVLVLQLFSKIVYVSWLFKII